MKRTFGFNGPPDTGTPALAGLAEIRTPQPPNCSTVSLLPDRRKSARSQRLVGIQAATTAGARLLPRRVISLAGAHLKILLEGSNFNRAIAAVRLKISRMIGNDVLAP